MNEHATQYILNSVGGLHMHGIKQVHKTSTIRNFKRTSAFNVYGGMAKAFDTVSFNVFRYAKAPMGAFVNAGLLALDYHHCITTFDLDKEKVTQALSDFADIYIEKNPYHNHLHGIDVCQMSHLHLIVLEKYHKKKIFRKPFCLLFPNLINENEDVELLDHHFLQYLLKLYILFLHL